MKSAALDDARIAPSVRPVLNAMDKLPIDHQVDARRQVAMHRELEESARPSAAARLRSAMKKPVASGVISSTAPRVLSASRFWRGLCTSACGQSASMAKSLAHSEFFLRRAPSSSDQTAAQHWGRDVTGEETLPGKGRHRVDQHRGRQGVGHAVGSRTTKASRNACGSSNTRSSGAGGRLKTHRFCKHRRLA